MLKRIGASLAAVCALLLPAQAQAYRVSPMSYELAPSGSKASQVIRIDNITNAPITLEMTAEKRSWDEAGNETRTPADDDFVILPPQMVVAPGKTQAVRVQFVGNSPANDTAMYVVSVNQVPVRDPNAPSGVQFVLNFGTAAYVVPPGAKTDLHVVGVERASEPGKLKVTLENRGARHAPLGLGTWTFTNAAGKSMVLTGDPLREALVASVVPSHGRRVYIIPAAGGFDIAGPVNLTIR